MSRLPVLVLTALTALLLGLSDAPARGGGASPAAEPRSDHATVKDPVGDAPATIDLVSGDYALSRKQVGFEVRVKELSESTFLAFEVHLNLDAWDRIAVYREHGRTVAKVYFVDTEDNPPPHPAPRACPGLKVSWSSARDTVSLTAPVSCLQGTESEAPPGYFHVYSRIGGMSGSPRDTMPRRTLDY